MNKIRLATNLLTTRLRTLISTKLGVCPKCIRSSIVGSIISWVGFAVLSFISPPPILLNLVIGVAIAFTILMVSHLVAFTIRMRRKLNSVDLSCCTDTASKDSTVMNNLNLNRREFLQFSLKVALVGSLFALAQPFRRVHAQDTCTGVSQTFSAGTKVTFTKCQDCQDARKHLQNTQLGVDVFCKEKFGAVCREKHCGSEIFPHCDLRTATALPRTPKGKALIFVSCKQTKTVCLSEDPPRTLAQITLTVKFAGVRCDCGCA